MHRAPTGAFLNAEPALAPTTGSVPSAQTVGGLTRADLAFASYQDPGGSAVGPHAGLVLGVHYGFGGD